MPVNVASGLHARQADGRKGLEKRKEKAQMERRGADQSRGPGCEVRGVNYLSVWAWPLICLY